MNRLPIYFLTVSLILLTFLSACEKDDPNEVTDISVELAINLEANGQSIVPNSIQNSLGGQSYSFTIFEAYFSNIRIVKADDTEVPLADVILYDFTDPQSITATLSTGTYKALRFGLGLDSLLNASDPSDPAFDENHPLSYLQETHWSWAAQYKFVTIEGFASPEADSETVDNTIVYHLGTNGLYREISLDKNIVLTADSTAPITLTIDANQILKDLDLINENVTQTMNNLPLATQVMDNFTQAFQ